MIKNINEIFAQIDSMGLATKEKNILKLLSEEGWLVVADYLDGINTDYSIKYENGTYEIKFTAFSTMSEERRKEFLTVGSGKNSRSKGVLGKLSAMFESLLYSYDWAAANNNGGIEVSPTASMGNYMACWSLNSDEADGREEKEWDGLEKSIIANFADDVSVGVRFGEVEIVIKKKF